MTFKQLFRTAPITLILITAVVSYFVLQVLLGVDMDSPTGSDLIRFGANAFPLSLFEPWRLLTAGFIHIGVLHLGFNAFALYYLGQVAEMLLGKWRFLLLFLLSVIGGNLLNLTHQYHTWHTTPSIGISAGASGGIMGIGACLTLFALSNKPYARYLDKKNLLILMGINLVMGFVITGIDNAGHIGGAVCGLMLAWAYVRKPSWFWGMGAVLGVVFVMTWYVLLQALPNLY